MINNRVLITGSSGFIGRNLVPKLLNLGFDILEITRTDSSTNNVSSSKANKRVSVFDSKFKEILNDFNPEIVIHLASYLTSSDEIGDIEKLIDSNIFFLSKVLCALKNIDLKLFINTGTSLEYALGNDEFLPGTFYAATKTASRFIVDYFSATNQFKQITIVPHTIYGANDSHKKVIDLICDSTSSISPINLSPGNQVLDFIYIDDVVDFYIFILENYNKLPIKSNYKLGSGIGYSLRQVASLIEEISGKKANINWGGINYRQNEVMYSVADMSKYNLDWKPRISIKEGLSRIILNRKSN